MVGERSSDTRAYAKKALQFERRRKRWTWINRIIKSMALFMLTLNIIESILMSLITRVHVGIFIPLLLVFLGYAWSYSDRKKRGD